MDLPLWVFGKDPRGFLEPADVVIRHDSARDVWTVQTTESHHRISADLISSRAIAGPSAPKTDFDFLVFGGRDQGILPTMTQDQLDRFAERARRSGRLVDLLNLIRLHLACVAGPDLAAATRSHFDELAGVGLVEENDVEILAHRGVHVIERSESLLWRLKVPSVLLRVAHDPRLGAGDLTHLPAGGEDLSFRSSAGLADGVYLMDAYLGPLMAAVSPSVWAFNVPRSFGNLIFTLGQPIAGTEGEAAELLQLIHVPGADRETQVPTVTPKGSGDAVKWWASALNDMFEVVSDFAVYASHTGVYQPARHMQTVLTVEQLFRRVTSAMVADRDANARRVLMFTALDTLERLTGIQLERYADVDVASKTLARLEEAVWPGAAEVLLPNARRAVEALREVQNGFFLYRQLGAHHIRVELPRGAKDLSPAAAAGLYVKMLRDATHGHGGNTDTSSARAEVLMAHHDGHLPAGLGLLAYLYLLDLLVDPERLRRVLTRRK